MNTYTLKTIVMAALFAFMITGSTIAQAGTIEGVVQGFQCTINQKVCPIDRMDPHMAIEKNFVVVDKDGGYYLISNVSQAVLARNVLNKVRITGDVNTKYKSVAADKIEIFREGAWKETWSAKMEKEEMERSRLGT